MGDLVTIKVISANLGKRQLDYEWVPSPPKITGAEDLAEASHKMKTDKSRSKKTKDKPREKKPGSRK